MLVLVLWAAPVDAATRVVRPGESIQAAIDAARPGDTVAVAAGVYAPTCSPRCERPSPPTNSSGGSDSSKHPHRCGASWGHGGETLGYETNAGSSPHGTHQAVLAINADQSVLGTRRAQMAISRLQELAYCG